MASFVGISSLIATYLSNKHHSLTIIALYHMLNTDNRNHFSTQVADYLFASIHQYHQCRQSVNVIYKILNLAALQLSFPPLPFPTVTHSFLSKNTIRNLQTLVIFDKCKTIRLLSAKLFLKINQCIHQCTGVGSDHLKRAWIGNLITNDLFYTIQSLIHLKSFMKCTQYQQIIEQINKIMMELSNQRQMNKIKALQIRQINISRNRNRVVDEQMNEPLAYFDFEHLLPFDKILIVGDGDFSFTLSFIRYLNQKNMLTGKHVIASCYPNVWKMIGIYCDLGFILHEIERFSYGHCDVLFNVDATQLNQNDSDLFGCIDCILWNLPQAETQSFDIGANKKLIESFLVCCHDLFAKNECLMRDKALFLSLHCNGFNRKKETMSRWKKRNSSLPKEKLLNETEIRNQFDTWDVAKKAKSLGFVLENMYRFDPLRFDGYRVLNHLSGTEFKGFHQAHSYHFKHQ